MSVESNLSGETRVEVESTVIAITRAVTRHTGEIYSLAPPGCRGPADVFAAEIMRSFTSRPGYHANSYDAASHGWVVKLHFQFMKRQLYRGGRATLVSRLKRAHAFSLLPFSRTHTPAYPRVFRGKENPIRIKIASC